MKKNELRIGSLFLVMLMILSLIFSGCLSASRKTAENDYDGKMKPKMNNANSTVTMDVADAKEGAPIPMGSPNRFDEEASSERYAEISENPFLETSRAPLSTFSIDVDTASYANVRRFINGGNIPPKDSVRIEELVNYFEYDYPQPISDVPFSVTTEVAKTPWNSKHKIVQIGLQGKKVSLDNAKPSNLVFLLDVSGSMQGELELLKNSLRVLVNQLTPKDRIAIVAYAGASGLVLPSTSVGDKNKILSALNMLESGGSTAGGEGIELAYKVAKQNFISNSSLIK